MIHPDLYREVLGSSPSHIKDLNGNNLKKKYLLTCEYIL